jgi:hypothetical protein
MTFFRRFVRALALMPVIVQGVQSLYLYPAGSPAPDPGNGRMRRAAVTIAIASFNGTASVWPREVRDPAAFTEGLGQIVDGIVACLMASIWTSK